MYMYMIICTHFSQSFSVRAHISENNKNVLLALIGQELCSSQSQTRCNDTLNTKREEERKEYIITIINNTTYVGSLAKFKNKHTFSMDPFSSKSCLKNLAVSMLTY